MSERQRLQLLDWHRDARSLYLLAIDLREGFQLPPDFGVEDGVPMREIHRDSREASPDSRGTSL